jgi:UDP-hydrolysing UDP-N-acetyl-D-glucosamine 2-epimerase
MRTIGVVTVGRSDYGLLRPILREIVASPDLGLALFVAGAHLRPEHGETVREIEDDGFPIAARIELSARSSDPVDYADAIGEGVAGFGRALAASRPDLLVLLGDRFEMLAAAIAALPRRLPIAHIHGGESSEGAFDESIRHALTKLSHLHLVSAEQHARLVRQLGEEPWRVIVTGAPGLDSLRDARPLTEDELEQRLGMRLNGPTLLVTYHPTTLDDGDVRDRVGEFLAAIDTAGLAAVFTFPNADPGGEEIRDAVTDYVSAHANACAVASLGTDAYAALLRRSAAMVGNSSSGILEAPSFGLPVVNVGRRQQGRLRAANVIDVGETRDEIVAGIERALAPDFRASLAELENPYGDGNAASRIVAALEAVELGPRLLEKRFCELDG